jgi:4-carboxymuconolactone decarboxylase
LSRLRQQVQGRITTALAPQNREIIMKIFAASLLSAGAMLLAGSMTGPLHAQAPPPAPPLPSASGTGAQPTRAQSLMGDFAPKLAELTDQVLFGDVWARPGLSPRDRSLVTVSALIAMNRPDQLRSHLIRARENGVTQEEVVEAITQLAFYAGWPNAVGAVSVAREVFQKK